jgi:hypothetical protein
LVVVLEETIPEYWGTILGPMLLGLLLSARGGIHYMLADLRCA